MSPTTAALVLGWICLVILAFGLAGLLQQVRELRIDLHQLGSQGPKPLIGRVLSSISQGRVPTYVLVASPECSMCEPAMWAFLQEPDSGTEARRALSYKRAPTWPNDPRAVIDAKLFEEVDAPWLPALIELDADGRVTAAEPVQSAADLEAQILTMSRKAEKQPAPVPSPR